MDATMSAKVFLTFLHGKQGRNEGASGAQSVGCRIISGSAESLQEAPKSPNNITSTFFTYGTFASERPQVRTLGRQTCFLPRAPSNLVTRLTAKSPILFGRISWSCTFA